MDCHDDDELRSSVYEAGFKAGFVCGRLAESSRAARHVLLAVTLSALLSTLATLAGAASHWLVTRCYG